MILLLTLVLAAGPAKAPPPPKGKGPPKTQATEPKAPAPEPAPAPKVDAPVAAPAPAPEPPTAPQAPKKREPVKLAASEWCNSGLDKIFVQTLETRFYDLLGNEGVAVVSPKDVTAVLGLERQRQMLGCTAEASCLAEIGGALGVDAILYGCIVKAGTGFTATLRAVGTKDAKPAASFSERVPNEDLLQDWMDSKAKVMSLQLRQNLGGEELSAQIAAASAVGVSRTGPGGGDDPGHALRSKSWIPLSVAAAGGLTAAVGFLQASTAMDELKAKLASQKSVTPESELIAARGQSMQTIGMVGAGVAAAGLATALVFYVLPTGGGPTPTVALTPSGVSFGIEGRLP